MKTNRLLTRLGIIYGPPEHDDPMAFFAEYARLLADYTEEELDAAADLILKTHKYRRWPTLSECVTACSDIRTANYCKAYPKRGDANPYPDWSTEAVRIADGLMNSQIGREAAKGGWSLGLHDFCRKTGRLPTQKEIPDIRIRARQFDEAYAKCCSGEAGVCSGALQNLGGSMLERRQKYADMAFGKTVGDAA